MALQYAILNGKQAAIAQNRDWWTKILGRAKNPGDITEFLFTLTPHPTNDTMLASLDDWGVQRLLPLLTTPERNAFNTNVRQASDPVVIQFLADVAAAQQR